MWGEKAQLAMEFDRTPQPTANIYWNPNCPFVKGKKKRIMSKSKLDILQANSKLFYAYICSSHFIFCASGGAAKTLTNTRHCFFSPPVPPSLWQPL